MGKKKNISTFRKIIYQIGIVLIIIGFLIFISTFILVAMNFNNLSDFDKFANKFVFRSFLGMILMIIGKILKSLGRSGIAGSGLILDTERERTDLEPINRMLGGQLNDILEESNIKSHIGLRNRNQIIKIKCQSCNHLNDEFDKFCSECGKKI